MTDGNRKFYDQLRDYCAERDILFSTALTSARQRWIQKHTPDIYKDLKRALGKWCSVKFRQVQVETAWFYWLSEKQLRLKVKATEARTIILEEKTISKK